jgi:hypothetical protein
MQSEEEMETRERYKLFEPGIPRDCVEALDRARDLEAKKRLS